MNKNTNSADVRCLTRATSKVFRQAYESKTLLKSSPLKFMALSKKEHRGHVISNARGPRHGSCANPCQLIEK